MDNAKKTPATMDEYITTFPANVQSLLEAMRQTIRKAAPQAEEAISYGMPTFRLKGRRLVYFAAFKQHIGFYPTGSAIEAFEKQLLGYKTSKGTLQFPFDQPIPLDLVTAIVRYRVEEVARK